MRALEPVISLTQSGNEVGRKRHFQSKGKNGKTDSKNTGLRKKILSFFKDQSKNYRLLPI